jgi:hypothetical protein
VMKTNRGVIDSRGNSARWWLYDGQRTVPVDSLTDEVKALPSTGIHSPTAIAEKLTMGWRPEMDTWPYEKRIEVIKKHHRPQTEPREPSTDFFLYFSDEQKAKKAGDELRHRGFKVDVHETPGSEQWAVIGCLRSIPPSSEFEKIEKDVEEIAQRYGGEYDGSGAGYLLP